MVNIEKIGAFGEGRNQHSGIDLRASESRLEADQLEAMCDIVEGRLQEITRWTERRPGDLMEQAPEVRDKVFDAVPFRDRS